MQKDRRDYIGNAPSQKGPAREETSAKKKNGLCGWSRFVVGSVSTTATANLHSDTYAVLSVPSPSQLRSHKSALHALLALCPLGRREGR